MTQTDVKIDEFYYFEFLDEWGNLNGSYKITGYASPDVIASIDESKSLYKLYFEQYGFDNEMYNKYIDKSTLVFIATKLVSTDPIETSISDDEILVYIPSSLVKYNKSYSYIKGYRTRYNFSSNPRIHDNLMKLNKFEKESKATIKDALRQTPEFVIDNLSILSDSIEVLMTQSEYDKYISEKKKKYTDLQTSDIQRKSNIESAERRLYESTIDMENSKSKYEKRYSDLTASIDESNKIVLSNVEQSNRLKMIKQYIIDTIADIMIRQPTAFDGVQGLSGNYTAEQVYNQIYNLVSAEE